MIRTRSLSVAFFAITSALAAAATVACGSSASDRSFQDGQDPSTSSDGTTPSGNLVGDADPSSNPAKDASADHAAPAIEVVYAHTASTLYKVDGKTNAITTVGPFQDCNDQVIDLAIDKDSNAFVTSFSGLYRLDLATAKCSLVKSGDFPNSLSFVPVGTLDPTNEVLVGYLGATYVRIDTTTGETKSVGGLTGGYTSSGDIVSVIGGGTFLTVKGNSCFDCLVQVDPKTGDLLQNYGTLGHSSVYGLAFWGGNAYGFAESGAVFVIKYKPGAGGTAGSLLVADLAIPGGSTGIAWYGAGSSTAVPVTDEDGGTIPVIK
ncbi:hypothetical protein [Labilithrix luteola]|nr:hypothetical protein [Labilithrix luteola]